MQQPFTAYRAADVPVIRVVAIFVWNASFCLPFRELVSAQVSIRKPIDGLEPPTYRLQGDCTAIVLYRLSRGKAVPFSFLSVTVLCATVLWIASENTFAETPQLKLCKQARSDSNAYLTVLETAVFPIKLPTYQYPPFISLV